MYKLVQQHYISGVHINAVPRLLSQSEKHRELPVWSVRRVQRFDELYVKYCALYGIVYSILCLGEISCANLTLSLGCACL